MLRRRRVANSSGLDERSLVLFDLPLKTSLIPLRSTGSATPTFTRATTATVADHEGVLRTVPSGCARMQGARLVRNLIVEAEVAQAKSEDFSGWAKIGTATTTGAKQVNLPAVGDAVMVNAGVSSVGMVCRGSIDLSGAGTVTLYVSNGVDALAGPDQVTVALTATPTRYTIIATWGASLGTPRLVITRNAGNTATTVQVDRAQVESVTGQSNTAPAEYVSVGVLAAPYHGAGVDGSKYFNTVNGNTVASNVVTEATGAAIATGLDGYLTEGARTQYLGVTDTPATQTTGALGTGTYTLWLDGTGSAAVAGATATITGAGTATAAAPVTFTVTVAGTVTVTVTGSLTRFQIENGAFRSGYIANSGAAGTTVTRNASVESNVTAGNISAAAGTLYLEFKPSHAPSGAVYLWGTYVDANNSIALLHDATNLIFRKRIGGVNYDATIALAFVSGARYKIAGRWGTSGVDLFASGVKGIGNTNAAAAQIAATMQFGADGNGAGQPFAALRDARIYSRALPDSTLQGVTA